MTTAAEWAPLCFWIEMVSCSEPAGGGIKSGRHELGQGAIFELTPHGSEKVLYTFKGGVDGRFPDSGLIEDAAGNLYGVTSEGGRGDSTANGYECCGTVFKLSPDGTESVLYAFQGGSDGAFPQGNLLEDASGNLYGATYIGGDQDCHIFGPPGCGTIFKLAPDGTKTMLHAFKGGTDGVSPNGALVMDESGDLYGTTSEGGAGGGRQLCGCGVVFKLSPDGREVILHAFRYSPDGAFPLAGLLRDSAGNLYGTTSGGGVREGWGCGDCGAVFEIGSDGVEKVLYAFKNRDDVVSPVAGLVEDTSGNLYGTTEWGGGIVCPGGSEGCGTLFKVAQDGTETVLHAFGSERGGAVPLAAPVMDRRGNLFGSTGLGGENCLTYGCCTVFEFRTRS